MNFKANSNGNFTCRDEYSLLDKFIFIAVKELFALPSVFHNLLSTPKQCETDWTIESHAKTQALRTSNLL